MDLPEPMINLAEAARTGHPSSSGIEQAGPFFSMRGSGRTARSWTLRRPLFLQFARFGHCTLQAGEVLLVGSMAVTVGPWPPQKTHFT